MSPVTIMSRAELTLTFQFLFKLNTVLKKLKSCMILFNIIHTGRQEMATACLSLSVLEESLKSIILVA